MTNYNNQEYQYDSCTSKGICSVSPKTSSLQEILILYLKYASYYLLKILKYTPIDEELKNLILNTISLIASGIELSESDFKSLADIYNKKIPELINQYKKYSADNGIKPALVKTILNFGKKTDIIKSIQLGEKEFNKKTQLMSADNQGLHKVLSLIARSLCVNILELESYGHNIDKEFVVILQLLNLMNEENPKEDNLIDAVLNFCTSDFDVMSAIRNIQIEKYGEQQESLVEYTTTPGKALLVVGSNIRELEIILEEFKSENIDVYTHDEMLLAHTFPKFKSYKNLKGQYGHGIKNCLLDFSTFPGPIILTRHSLYNVENLYRGQLYTTDIVYKKGIIPIRKGNFSEVINAAKNSRGFKHGKKCSIEKVGFSYSETIQKIKEKLDSNTYSEILIIGILGSSFEQKNYFENLLKKVPDSILTISFACSEIIKPNIINLNSGYDAFVISKITDEIFKMTNKKIALFYPECDSHTISTMIHFSKQKNVSVFVGKCTPMIFNPNLIKILTKVFNIKQTSSVKTDLSKFIEQL